MNVKVQLNRLSKRYLAALGTHLGQSLRASLKPAMRLGRQTVALGFETLDLAKIHKRALSILEITKGKNGLVERAEKFFQEANRHLEETHRASRATAGDLNALEKTLDQCTEEMAATNCQLKRGIVQRKLRENTLKKRRGRHQNCLQESLRVQQRLRQLTHRVLVMQEDERNYISHELQDEIAQTLLGINVRLLSLKAAARSNNKGFKNEITNAQQLVTKSVQTVRKFAREIGVHHPS